MIALGLFDGMSGGQIALTELGFPLTKYYSSEIDKFANQQIMLNFPNTVQLGSVTDVDVSQLEPIDLLLGGSPCLAGDTWVATDSGWKQLLRVRPDDRVFDGVEWVSHQGLVSKGMKSCTSVFGVNITPDHLIYMGDDQWEPVVALTVETYRKATLTASDMASEKLSPPPEDLGYLPESKPIEVYDLLNAGPRSRFTIATNDGLLIVHNCQSFSFAGKRKGMATKCDIEILDLDTYLGLKAAGFEFEGQSYLFWEYVRILRDIRKYNPGVKFLLENVKMGKKWEAVLTKAIGCEGIHINSALVCAQNRRRIYWTNIEGIQQPADRGILLRDILEDEVDEKYYLSSMVLDRAARKVYSSPQINPDKTGTLNTKNNSGQMSIDSGTTFVKLDKQLNPKRDQFKAGCLTAGAHSGGNHSDMDLICVAMRSRNPENPSDRTTGAPTEQRLEPNCLTTVGKDNLVLTQRQEANLRQPDEKTNSFLATSWKGSQANGMTLVGTPRIRRLTPTECCRLQTVPDWYLWAVSSTQQYKMLGNGWTIEVIKHILSYWWEGYLL